jgi:ribosome recycling factor
MAQNTILKKLKEHDCRFDAHNKRFDAHDERFDKLIKWNFRLEDDIKSLEIKMDKRFDAVISAIDSFVKQTKDFKIEQVSLSQIASRHEKDIIRIKKLIKAN